MTWGPLFGAQSRCFLLNSSSFTEKWSIESESVRDYHTLQLLQFQFRYIMSSKIVTCHTSDTSNMSNTSNMWISAGVELLPLLTCKPWSQPTNFAPKIFKKKSKIDTMCCSRCGWWFWPPSYYVKIDMLIWLPFGNVQVYCSTVSRIWLQIQSKFFLSFKSGRFFDLYFTDFQIFL